MELIRGQKKETIRTISIAVAGWGCSERGNFSCIGKSSRQYSIESSGEEEPERDLNLSRRQEGCHGTYTLLIKEGV